MACIPESTGLRNICFWVGICAVAAMLFVGCTRSPGARLYTDSGCARCHGADFSGTRLGPPLKGLKANWTTESLARYLEQPAGFRRSDRLKALHEKYRITMPQFDMAPEERKILVKYVLEKSD